MSETPKMLEAMRREIASRRDEAKAVHQWPCLCDDCALPITPAAPSSAASERREELSAIRDVLHAAWKFNDKPHQLFSAIARLADKYEPDQADRAEIRRLMDRAYTNIGRARKVWADPTRTVVEGPTA